MIRTKVAAGALALALMTAGIGASPLIAAMQDTKTPASASTTPMTLVNLNSATSDELQKLPGVGPALAARILDYRQKNGGFKKIEDLMNVKGIGEKAFLKLKPQITVTPVRVAER
ncbi:MAG TPA: helix-hairpin-helix domain-containing protein [Vicinamibacterales bacterium]|jgi:comEA protein|nr:helix-hairpin-helix domain-containing protein [Vicinamibacterales bacterium]